MRLYLEAMRLSYRRYRAYGAANVAGLITNAFWGLLRSYVFIALYRTRPVAEGYDLHDALTYVWATQALIMPIMMWGWVEIAETIRTGDVVSDLSKPFSYFGFWLSRDLGRAGYHLLFRWLPTMLVGLILFQIRLPERPVTWLLYALSLLLAIILSFCIRFIINVGAFWVTDVRGLFSMVLTAVNFLSGFLVPLEFFPPLFRTLVEALPFAGMISIPMNVFLERAQGIDALLLLGKQALWVGTFALAAELLLRRATRKLVVQGG